MMSAWIYDFVIVWMTEKWYEAFFDKTGAKFRILDIGVGTATALLRHKDLIRRKNLSIVGVDYDQSYIDAAKENVKNAKMEDHIELLCLDWYSEEVHKLLKDREFDAVYFSGSISLMPDAEEAFRISKKYLNPELGMIYVTQTFQTEPSPFMEFYKPLLRYLTTIDFGKMMLLDDILKCYENAELEIRINETIKDSIHTKSQVAKLLAGAPW